MAELSILDKNGEQYVSVKDLKLMLYERALRSENNVQIYHIKQIIKLLEEIEGSEYTTLRAI